MINFHKDFKKAYLKLPKKIQNKVDRQISLFVEEPFANELNNHALTGRYKGYRSINITGDYRAHYLNVADHQIVFFVNVGTHAQLYG